MTPASSDQEWMPYVFNVSNAPELRYQLGGEQDSWRQDPWRSSFPVLKLLGEVEGPGHLRPHTSLSFFCEVFPGFEDV